ncbi:CRE-DCP-66 protein [Caenorhabditis remanei]|uniref:CRE-DCP-66 protein n=1 Tax=Caenorhabditis remanei TaxID=31234 RepID=E3N7M5_CAERE|nr:CRE-DCP-66 protein [Caenorhabditis remanei]
MNSDDSLTHLQNGVALFHGTPTKEMNGGHHGQSTSLMETADDGLQLSPSDLRRRSTRASALKAQEKIKLKDDIVQGPQKRLNEENEETEGIDGGNLEQDPLKKVKKRRLEDGRDLDQTCFRFGLRANDDGEVYAMTDESENSSIHESEMEIVRYHYEKMKSRELDEEQLKERLKIRREAEQQLREEEAKLQVLKKMKDSQNRAINKLAAETKAADLADAAAAAAAAYKPVLAGGKLSANGKSQAAMTVNKTMAGLANLTVQQQLELLGKLASQSPAAKQAYALAKKNPAQTTQLFAQLIQLNTLQVQKQKDAAAAAAQEAAAAALSSSSAHTIQHVAPSIPQQPVLTQSKLLNQQTPAQRIQAARLAFRAQADKQLMTIPTQKSQPHDITFLPNPNASAFLALHGLDLTVQYVLKDKSVFEAYSDPSYECEECKTDHAHTWKAIGSTPDDLHLYCENCVRSAQKRKNRTDQTNLLKRAFQKISAQEKEFEKKIAEGQLEQFAEAKAAVATAAPVTQQIPTSSTATVSSTPLPPRLQQMPSSSGSSTPTQHKASVPSTPKSSNSASAKKAMSNQQAANQMMAQMMQNSMKNPQMMQQLMFQMATAAAAQQQLASGGRNASAAATNQMAMFMAQAQAMAQVQAAQQAAQQAAAQQAAQQAQQAHTNRARETAQQQQQQMLIALLANQSGMSAQALQQIRNLTPAQQKSLMESIRNQQQRR